MNHVDDAIDIAISTIFIAFMLVLGIWCTQSLKALYAQPVIEKTAPTVQLNRLAPEHEYDGASCLLELVVNDAFCPDPGTVHYYIITEAQVNSFYKSPPQNGNDYYSKSWFEEVARRATAGQPDYMSSIKKTTITYNATWFSDKERSINNKWDAFFKDATWNATSKWHLFYSSAGEPVYWECVIINP